MKTFDDDKMNYDENGYYPDEKEQKDENKPILFDKIVNKLLLPYMIVVAFFIMKFSQNDEGYKIVILFAHLFILFGLLGTISEAIKRHKLCIPTLVCSVAGLAAVVAALAYHNGSADLKSMLLKIGIFLFFMIFIVIGTIVVVTELQGSKGNAKRCTVSVTAKCVNVNVSTVTTNGKTKDYYNPTYEYEYEGVSYKSKVSNVSESRHNDMNYDIFVDPDDPKTIYDPDSVKSYFMAITFGALFIVMPLIMMIVIFAFIKF